MAVLSCLVGLVAKEVPVTFPRLCEKAVAEHPLSSVTPIPRASSPLSHWHRG